MEMMGWNGWLVLTTLIFIPTTAGPQVYGDSSSSLSAGFSSSSSGSSSEPASSSSVGGDLATAEARGGERWCALPPRWEGSWFQSGVHTNININSTAISNKGACVQSDGDKFLVFNKRDSCYRCLVFHEKHLNVLQYKETFCIKDNKRRSLRSVCSTITGDANLFSMFRLDALPVECPFKGGFTFTYNRGHGDCGYPVSTVDSCIHPSRLLFSFQACPDVHGTESTVEELECLGTWKEGSSRYLLGLIKYQHHSASYEERFRCFVYEKSKKGGVFSTPDVGVKVQVPGIVSVAAAGNKSTVPLTASLSSSRGEDGERASQGDILIRVAQSGDATCNGLTPMEGSRTMILKKAPPEPKCQFPSWARTHAQWHTLDQRSTFVFEPSVLRVSNASDLARMGPNTLAMTGQCHHIRENPTLDRVLLVLHVTSECKSGFVCGAIYRRDGHIVEMQLGTLARHPADACHVSYFNSSQLPYVTLVSSTPETRQCPNLGQFEVTGLSREGRPLKPEACSEGGFSTLRVGCSSLDTLSFRSSGCSGIGPITTGSYEYACHGWWEEGGVSYLITTPLSRASSGPVRYCFVFRETLVEPTNNNNNNRQQKPGESSSPEFKRILHFSSTSDSCQRNISPGSGGALAFNVSNHGRCDDTNGSFGVLSQPQYALLVPIITLLSLFNI